MKMKSSLSVLFFLAFFCFSVWIPNGCSYSDNNEIPSSNKTIQWHAYDEGMELGQIESKKIFLFFTADWCKYCKKMEHETFKDLSVATYLNQHFIPIKLNADNNKRLAMHYSMRGLPLIWFLTEDGEKIENLPGYVSADVLTNILKFIQTNSYKTMSYSEFIKLK